MNPYESPTHCEEVVWQPLPVEFWLLVICALVMVVGALSFWVGANIELWTGPTELVWDCKRFGLGLLVIGFGPAVIFYLKLRKDYP